MLVDSAVRIRFGAVWWCFLFSIFWLLYGLITFQLAMMPFTLSVFVSSFGGPTCAFVVLFGRCPSVLLASLVHFRMFFVEFEASR
jgi:hypothetical protein